MNNKNTIKYAVLNAVLAVVYIALVATFMENVGPIVGPTKGILGPMMFLLVFVISAAVMGMVVFGRPVMWYLNGSKREAILLAIGTVACLALFAIVVLCTLLFVL